VPDVDENTWRKAKRTVLTKFPEVSRESHRFWDYVQDVYLTYRPFRKGKAGQLSESQLESLQWEPPGGDHPATWRAQVGNDYVYRVEKPGHAGEEGDVGEAFTQEEMEQKLKGEEPVILTFRQATIKWGIAEHKKAMEQAATKTVHDFHSSEMRRKLDLASLKVSLAESVQQFLSETPTAEVAAEQVKLERPKPEAAQDEKDKKDEKDEDGADA